MTDYIEDIEIISIVKKMIRSGKLTKDEIIEGFDITEEQYLQIKKEYDLENQLLDISEVMKRMDSKTLTKHFDCFDELNVIVLKRYKRKIEESIEHEVFTLFSLIDEYFFEEIEGGNMYLGQYGYDFSTALCFKIYLLEEGYIEKILLKETINDREDFRKLVKKHNCDRLLLSLNIIGNCMSFDILERDYTSKQIFNIILKYYKNSNEYKNVFNIFTSLLSLSWDTKYCWRFKDKESIELERI